MDDGNGLNMHYNNNNNNNNNNKERRKRLNFNCRKNYSYYLGFVFLIVFLLCQNVNASEECRTACSGAAKTFKYTPGSTYKYNYNGKIDISLSSAEGQTTSTEVKTEVTVYQQDSCNQIITLQNFQILDTSGKKTGTITNIEFPIRININDGELSDSICIVDGDNQNSLNVKRAIASILQTSLKSGYETDVFGRCPTDISTTTDGNNLIIQKTRNLNKCSYRESIRHDFLTTAFNLNSEIKSSPILNGDYQASIKVKDGVLDSATVTENYLFVPFSVGQNGAKAQITSHIQFSGMGRGSQGALVTKPKSIIFENPHPVISPTTNVHTIVNAVKEVAKTVDVQVNENTAKELVTLIKVVRVSKKSDLLAAYNQIKSGAGVADKELAKKFFIDALLRSGNGDSIEALLELLTKNELSDFETKHVLLRLSVVRHATEGSLNAAVHLLDTPNVPREAYLGVGNLAGRFCRTHACDNVPAVKTLVNKLVAKVGSKVANREQEADTIYALKALGNLHYLNDNAVQKLIGVAQTKNLPNRVRVAALEAYLADPCKNKLRDSALQILQDTQQDSEIRIKAYLAVAQCPNAKAGNAIKTLLEDEPSIQVGGFITSHIRTIRTSTNQDKAVAKQFLNFTPHKRFAIDPRRFSFNGEFSYAIDTLGSAASAETDVIYSQNSWLPRSTSLNLTAEIFGHNFNFLEIKARQENLDKLVEHYFGPNGVLRNSAAKEYVEKGYTSLQKVFGYAKDKLKSELHRSRRDVSKAEIDHIAKQIQVKTNDFNKDLDLDVTFKAFGSENLFINVNQEAADVNPEAIIDKIIQKFGQGLDKLKNFEEVLRTNLILLDAEFDYPTSLGFPLRLAVEGTAAVQTKVGGNIDVRKLLNDPDNGELKGVLIPSASIEVTGRLTLDALVVENGLKVISTLYTSSGTSIGLSWSKSGFNFKFGLPLAEEKLISLNHEIVFHIREQTGREQNVPLKFTQVKDFSICFDQLSKFIGSSLCASVSGPDRSGTQIPVLPFPLSGDANFALSLEHGDASEYQLTYKLATPSHIDVSLDLLNRKNEKKLSIDFKAEYAPDKFIITTLNAPGKQASAEAKIISTNTEKSLLIRILNDKNEYSSKIGVSVSGSPARTVYKPILQYKTPNGEHPLPISIQGQVVVEKQNENVKVLLEQVKISDQQRDIGINGKLGSEDGALFTDVTVTSGKHSFTVEGRLKYSAEHTRFNIGVINSVNNNANFNLKGEFKRKPNDYESSLQLVHGRDLQSKTKILTIQHRVLNKFVSSRDFKYAWSNSIQYPLLKLSGKFNVETTPKSLEYEVNAIYGDFNVGSELDFEINEKTMGDFKLEFDIWGLDNKLELKTKREVLGNDESKVSSSVQVNDKKWEANGKVKHLIKPQNVDVSGDVAITIPGHAVPFKVTAGLKVTVEELDTYLKVNSGNENIIDAFLKTDKIGNANGNVKANIKDSLKINGKLQSNKGAGNGDIIIDIGSGKRVIKGDTTFKYVVLNVLDVSVNIYPDFNKDKNLVISISTQNKLSETSIDSKNKANILGYKTEVNTKGSKTGEFQNGELQGEIEVILPDDKYILAKAYRDHKLNGKAINQKAEGSIEYRTNKNTPGRKLSWSGNWKNTNFKEGPIDITYGFAADDSNGKNVNVDVSLKGTNQGGTSLTLNNKIHGSILQHPIELTATYSGHGKTGQYELRNTYGPTKSATIKGKYDGSSETKKSGEFSLQLLSDSKVLKSLNIELSGSVNKPKGVPLPFQFDGSASVSATDETAEPLVNFKGQGSVSVGEKDGHLKTNIAIAKLDPINAEASYNYGVDKIDGKVAVEYAKGKAIKVNSAVQKVGENRRKLTAQIQTSYEGYKNIDLSAETERSEELGKIKNSFHLGIDNKNYDGQLELVLSDHTPVFSFKVTTPEGKVTEIYAKAVTTSHKQLSGDFKLANGNTDFLFEFGYNVNIENVDNFNINGYANSPKLKINKIKFDAQNGGGTNNRKVQIQVTSDNKNLVSGTANYAAKDDAGKFIIEGSGSFKVREEVKSGNFKYIVQKLESSKDGEMGLKISFDAILGTLAFDSEFKFTNKQFRFENSYCEQKKECAYLEIDNKINTNELYNFNHNLEINVDLRKLGLSHEFGLKAVTTRKNFVIDHTVDVHFENQDDSKYQYSVYLHPTEAGLSLTTPKRIVSLEGKSQITNKNREHSKGNGELAFYLDKKNHANKKTALIWAYEADVKGVLNWELKFTHPGLKKPLLASSKATQTGHRLDGKLDVITELDVFAQDNQKLVLTYNYQGSLHSDNGKFVGKFKVESKGLGILIDGTRTLTYDKAQKLYEDKIQYNYRIGKNQHEDLWHIKLTPTEIKGLLKVFDKDLISFDYTLKINEQEQVIDGQISSYHNNPFVHKIEVKNYNTITLTAGFKNTPQNKFEFNAGFIPGQIADIRADYTKEGQKSPLFFATTKLDDADFLKSDYKVDSKTIDAFVTTVKDRLTSYLKSVESLIKNHVNHIKLEGTTLKESLKKAAPNLNPLKQYYTKELQEFKQEILNDKSLKELSEAVAKVLGALISATSEIFEKINHLIEESAQAIQKTFAGVTDTIQNNLVPQIREGLKVGIELFSGLLTSVLDITSTIIAKAALVLEKYQPEIKALVTPLREISQDAVRFVQKAYQVIKDNIQSHLINKEYLQQLKGQLNDFVKEHLPDQEVIINSLNELLSTVDDFIPPDFIVKSDIHQLLQAIRTYIEKKVRNEAVDDSVTLETIVKSTIGIVTKLFKLVTSEFKWSDAKIDSGSLQLPNNFITNIPRLVAAKSSLLNYLLNYNVYADLSNAIQSTLTSPKQIFPPFPLFGLIVQQHIFTFDGNQLSLPATCSCSYLLARDAVNGNFTVAATYKDGQLQSVTLADKNDVLTLTKGGQVKLGNTVSDLPVRKPHIAAYRDYNIITLYSTAGVELNCVPELTGCVISISGYYHGQTKGLFGNGNGETFDDYSLPNGKVVNAGSDFVNSYKLNSDCANVEVKPVKINPACNELFSFESPSLALCYPFVPTENFKAACSHGLDANVKGTEELIAKAYVAACLEKHIPARVPKKLVKCTNSDKTFDVGDTFSVKLPSKSADVILLVDTDKKNEVLYKQLVQPLVQELSKELHSKGVTDVEFHLITYGGVNEWPSHVTTQGKLTFKGKIPQVKFAEAPKRLFDINDIKNDKLSYYVAYAADLIGDLNLATGSNLETRTFDEGTKYPFRANALKTIVIVNGKSCQTGRFLPIQKLMAFSYRNTQYSVNYFTPIETLSAKDSKTAKDIIGFNKQTVFTVSQSKKNPKGSSELYKELNYNDYCIDHVINNRGNTFVNDNFLANKGEQKQFVHVAALNIVEQLINVEQGLDCECKLVDPWNAQNVCKEVYSNDRPSKKV